VDDVLRRIDDFGDTVPRQWAKMVVDGPLRLFVRESPGWPFYARPIPGARAVDVEDVRRMRARQRSLGVPEVFEWVPARAPSMTDAVAATGLSVRLCPLLVLTGDPIPAAFPPGCSARLLGPADGDLATASAALNAVAAAAFGAPPLGAPSEREVARLRADLAAGAVARLLVTDADGPVAAGSAQRAGDVVELVGIGTVQRARGRGLGAAVTATLARAARAAGADLVFLAAGDDTATRVYERVGFRRVGECALAES
jgi:ribosomal protein S18 acetylase RimI-like enzyme